MGLALVANFAPDSLTGSNAQIYVTSNKGAATFNVLADINDTAGTPTILSVTQPVNGSVTINPDGTLTFAPNAKFHGSTQFSFTAGTGMEPPSQGGNHRQLVRRQRGHLCGAIAGRRGNQ